MTMALLVGGRRTLMVRYGRAAAGVRWGELVAPAGRIDD